MDDGATKHVEKKTHRWWIDAKVFFNYCFNAIFIRSFPLFVEAVRGRRRRVCAEDLAIIASVLMKNDTEETINNHRNEVSKFQNSKHSPTVDNRLTFPIAVARKALNSHRTRWAFGFVFITNVSNKPRQMQQWTAEFHASQFHSTFNFNWGKLSVVNFIRRHSNVEIWSKTSNWQLAALLLTIQENLFALRRTKNTKWQWKWTVEKCVSRLFAKAIELIAKQISIKIEAKGEKKCVVQKSVLVATA